MEENFGTPVQAGTVNYVEGGSVIAQNQEYTNQQAAAQVVTSSTTTSNTQSVMTEAPVQEQVNEQPTVQAVVEEAPVQEAKPAVRLAIPEVEANAQKIIVETNLLKNAIKKADVVASKIDIQPLTEVVMMRVVNGILQLRSTDVENMLTVKVPVIEATEGLTITLKLTELKPLIDKITDSVVAIILDGFVVTIKTVNGEYKYNQSIDLTTNEVIKLPEVDADVLPIEETTVVDGVKFTQALETVIPLIAHLPGDDKNSAVSLGDRVVTTTGTEVAVCNENIAALTGTTALIKSTTARELLAMGVGDKINIGYGSMSGVPVVTFFTTDYRLFAVLKENSEQYPLDECNAMLSQTAAAPIQLSKEVVLSSIDRLSLFFTSSLNRQPLSFEKSAQSALKISNEARAQESIAAKGFGEIMTKLDAKRFTVALKAIKTDEVILETLTDANGTAVPFLKISSSDRKEGFVLGLAL